MLVPSSRFKDMPSADTPSGQNPVEQLLLPHIRRMRGYVPGEQPRDRDFIKLNTNENPYPPAPGVLDAVRQGVGPQLKVYPDPDATAVRQGLAALFGVDVEQTLVGNGSDEILNIILRCFAAPGQTVAYPYPTYGYYDTLVAVQGARSATVDFAEDFSLPPALADTGARVTFLPNPNAPSGTLLASDAIADLAGRLDGVLVVDEAYVDFADGGCIPLLADHDNLIVVRTLSKSYSLAGMRIGFCCAHPQLIAGMWKAKDHYNVNRLSLLAAEAALADVEYMQANARRIGQTRQRLEDDLRRLGFEVWPSAANFVLCRRQTPDAAQLYRDLKERRILVRHFDQRRLDDCLRISVGTDAETNALVAALEEILA